MKRLIRCCASAVFLQLALAASAGADTAGSWEFQRESEGVSVYTRPVEGSPYAEVRGTVVLRTPLAAVMGVLDDVAAYPEWIHRCTSAKRLDGTGASEHLIYQVTDLPFPVRDRDMVIRATVTYNPAGDVRVTLIAEEPAIVPREKAFVRIVSARGSYLIEPLPDGEVRVTWTQFVDPNGPVPGFIVNRMLQETPQRTLAQLRHQVALPRYRALTFVHDEHGRPMDVAPKSW